ncbi:MAG TPA: YlxR family protein [Solirubrobacteraceae bacterium]|nr:YlxR family protein [Solirubrobacteraceae bacterium]
MAPANAGGAGPEHRRRVPSRRCIGCGRRAPKHELVRLAVRDDDGRAVAVADTHKRMPGRGAYLCAGPGPAGANPPCLERAGRRGSLARAFRARVSAGPELVESV